MWYSLRVLFSLCGADSENNADHEKNCDGKFYDEEHLDIGEVVVRDESSNTDGDDCCHDIGAANDSDSSINRAVHRAPPVLLRAVPFS